MQDIIYIKYGKKYRKLNRDEIITRGAMHSYDNGELNPIINPDTVGKTPNDFLPRRDFYNLIKEESNE